MYQLNATEVYIHHIHRLGLQDEVWYIWPTGLVALTHTTHALLYQVFYNHT